MNVLITGGAGFLGLHLSKLFHEKKANITLVDIAPYNKKEYSKNCLFVNGDVRDKKLMATLVKNKDVVIHAAAALPLWSKKEIFDTNVNGTKIVLDASFKNKVKRFIFISSTAVYGIPKKHPIFETDPVFGVGSYGESKIEAEQACQEYRKKGLAVTVVRPKTFIGTHRLGVFEILYDWIKDGKKIPMIGSGNNCYQLLAVDDLVEIIYLLSINSKIKDINGVFNIGAKKFSTVKKDLQQLFDYANSGSRLLPTPAFLVKKILWFFEKIGLSPLYQWIYDTADKDSFVSIEKITKLLKWEPRYSNGQALIKSFQWYLDNYQEIKSRGSGITHTVGWKQGILSLVKKLM